MALHFDVELVSPLDNGLITDLVLALSSSLNIAVCSGIPVISDTSSHSNDLMGLSNGLNQKSILFTGCSQVC